ncbi:MAG TPA: ABC transporter ATP-binding protein [Erysipelothrix sp.]|nr:ABC transporter ATP-binding protein [Erysipelothrix sp.]
MSKTITIKNAVKRYGENTVIPNLSLQIENSELFTLLGPSGCGKTTLLRMIAGFNTIEGGEFYFDDSLINNMEPGQRKIGMVFQNYAIFPNMTVRKNVAFGLKYLDISKEEAKETTEEFLKLVHVHPYADRMPDKLSGGQQQRVALARALVIKPDVLLMDEPLSNLDAKLRVEMRTVIKQIQKEVGITTVYVTHDQEEAMAISDRIAVMKDGEIRHCSTPQNIYLRPADLFVATFIGKSNLINAELIGRDQNAVVKFSNGYEVELDTVRNEETFDRNVTVSIRPEEFKIIKTESIDDDQGIHGVIKDSIFLGLNTHYLVTLETGEDVEIIQESSIDKIIPEGSSITLVVNSEKMNVFDTDTTLSLMKDVNNNIVIDAQGVGETHD